MSSNIAASNQKRYRELIDAAQVNDGLWIAESTDFVLILPNECGEELILVWPTAEAARATIGARPGFADYQPVHRPLERWLSKTTPALVEDGILVAAHPDENLDCLRVPAGSFANDLSAHPVLQGKDLSRLRRKVAKRRQQDNKA